MKYLLCAGLICLLIAGIVGCGGGEEEQTTPTRPPDEPSLPPEPGNPGALLDQPKAEINVAAILPSGYIG